MFKIRDQFTIVAVVLFVSLLLACSVFLSSCATPPDGTAPSQATTLGNGKVDPTEAAALRVAVGLAFTARPDTVAPAYTVSTAILAVLADGSGQGVALNAIDGVIATETAKLKLDPYTLQSFNDLILLAKAQVMQQFNNPAGQDSILSPANIKIDVSSQILVVRDVVTIVQQSAAVRLGITAPAALSAPAQQATPVAPASPAVPVTQPTPIK